MSLNELEKQNELAYSIHDALVKMTTDVMVKNSKALSTLDRDNAEYWRQRAERDKEKAFRDLAEKITNK